MARMIPSYIDISESPSGEVEIFELLKIEGPNEWIVLHSLDLPRHVRQVEGEIDFLILIPGGAVICLEIKSHEVVTRDRHGIWHLGNHTERRGPFRQAAEAMRSTLDRLQGTNGLSGVPFISAVGFPRCQFNVPATEWEEWQVFDETALRQLGIREVIERIVRSTRTKFKRVPTALWFRDELGEPTEVECEKVRDVLRPVFERQRSPKERRAENQRELRRFTEEQFKALDSLEANMRIAFSGAAGTGKTFLALEAARRSTGNGQRSLLCCYNRLLGDWLEREAGPLASNGYVGTLHKLIFKISGETSRSDGADAGYWTEELPALAVDRLLRGHPLAESFDLVVIDEAQDICTDPYLDVIDLLLKGGLKNGRIRAFGDFSHQAIYTENNGRELLASRTHGLVQFELTENCRNRPRIGHLAALLSGSKSPYREFRRKDDGIDIDILKFDEGQSQTSALEQAIDRLRAENHQLGDIAILSPFKADAAASRLGDPYKGWLTPAADARTGKIRVSTVHSFKGLESIAVVVTDIRRVDRPTDRQLLYIAASRATDRLILLVNENIAVDMMNLVI